MIFENFENLRNIYLQQLVLMVISCSQSKKVLFRTHISAHLDDLGITIVLLVLYNLLKCEEMCKGIWNFLSEINQSTPKLSVASDCF